jgi:protein-tyrosine kinase
MSLIQRAMQESGVVVVARPDARPRSKAAPASTPDLRQPPQLFSLDFRRLAGDGFITPSDHNSRLANEFSNVKRRLLRRMGFFKNFVNRPQSQGGNVVIVTSAMPAEGKTFTAVNLALSLAMDERLKVLLIDADFARSSVCELFGLRGQKGVLDRLQNPALDFTALLQHARDLPLAVLPTGSCRMPVARIFAENAFGAFLDEVSSHFADHLIIIDSPPLLATTEAAVLSEHASQILLVVEAGRSTRENVGSALELIAAEEKVSLVLNRSFLSGSAGTRYYGSYREPVDDGPYEGATVN